MICEGWEGGTVDGKFPLLEWLGGWADRCVFLTVRQGTQKANIKLILAGGAEADTFLSKWEDAKTLSHPSLVQLMETGRYAIHGNDVVYLVTELADTFLSAIIPRKALDPADVRAILEPVVDGLVFLHGKRLVHANLKPSNIVLVADRWKLAYDEMVGSGDRAKPDRKPDAYDAPESAEGPWTPAADMWSLGMIVVEAFERRTPSWDSSEKSNPAVPDSIPEPFREIARGCLRREPEGRISIADVKALLESHGLIPAASASGPDEVKLAAEEAEHPPSPKAEQADEPGDRIREPEPAEFAPRSRMFINLEDEDDEPTGRKGSVFLVVVVLLIAAVLAVRAFRGRLGLGGESQIAPSESNSSSEPRAPQNPPAPAGSGQSQPASQPETAPEESPSAASKPPAPETQKPSEAPQNAPKSQASGELPAENQPATKQETDRPRSPAMPSVQGIGGKAAVVQRVLPHVEPGASESMRRPVDVELRVLVDENGSVSNVEYMTGGQGNYFARIARKAAESWKFKAPESNGQPVPSKWVLLFRFDRRNVDVTATELP